MSPEDEKAIRRIEFLQRRQVATDAEKATLRILEKRRDLETYHKARTKAERDFEISEDRRRKAS